MIVSVVIPVYNEAATLAQIVERVREAPVTSEIILVDDCSTDGSRELVKTLARGEGVQGVFHEVNRGKGAALRSGYSARYTTTPAGRLCNRSSCPLRRYARHN